MSETALPAPAGSAVRSRRREAVISILERYALVWLLLLMCVFFALDPSTSKVFISVTNIRTIAANEAVTGLVALAALLPLVGMRFDVSVGALLGGVTVFVAYLTVNLHWPLVAALAAAIATGACVGAVSGWITAYLGANSFIITLGMATLVGGIVALFSADQTIVGVPQALLTFGDGLWLGVPAPTWLLIVVALLVSYMLRYTVFGRQLVQIGSNPRSAQLVGIPVRRLVFLTFVLSGTLAAIAGEVQLSRTGSGVPGDFSSFTLNALAACFLGSTTIRPGQFNVPGTLVGVFFVAVAVNGLTLAGASTWVEPTFNGAAVVIAVALSTILARRRGLGGQS